MTRRSKKNPRDPGTWTNKQIEQDSEGYVAAQQAHREDKERAERQRREANDEARFVERFVAAGGRAADAPGAWRKTRNEQAAQAAALADASALHGSRRSARSVL